MTNQIQPSYPQEEQPERFYCRFCGKVIWVIDGRWQQSTSGYPDYCCHEINRRLPENAQKRREVEEYLREARG